MQRPKGKDTIDLTYVAAFLEARELCLKTGEAQPIKGYANLKVSPVKGEDLAFD